MGRFRSVGSDGFVLFCVPQVRKLVVEITVAGCEVDPPNAIIRWNRKICSSSHEVHVPANFEGTKFRCQVKVEAPVVPTNTRERDAQEVFRASFFIPRVRAAGMASTPNQLLAADSMLVERIREVERQVCHANERLSQLEAWAHVPPELLPAVVQIGVALPVTTGVAQAGYRIAGLASFAGVQYAVITTGTGWFFDARGLVFTCEHVRRISRRYLSDHDGKLIVCPHVEGELNWQAHAWRAIVLAHTGHWDGAMNCQDGALDWGEREPLSDGVAVLPERTDAAILWVREHLGSSTPVTNPVRVPTRINPVTTLRLGDPAKLVPTQKVYTLGFADIGGTTPSHTSGAFCSTLSDKDGMWLKLDGLVCSGHSGGPVVAQCASEPTAAGSSSDPPVPRGEVVGWTVRGSLVEDGQAGMHYARLISEARARIDIALERAERLVS